MLVHQFLEEAAARFRALGAEVLEAWALTALAVLRVRGRHPDAWSTAVSAEELARRTGVPGAQAIAYAALAAGGGPRAASNRATMSSSLARSTAVTTSTGLDFTSTCWAAVARPRTVISGGVNRDQ